MASRAFDRSMLSLFPVPSRRNVANYFVTSIASIDVAARHDVDTRSRPLGQFPTENATYLTGESGNQARVARTLAVTGRVYASVAHCVCPRHGSMAQTSRIRLPTVSDSVAEKESPPADDRRSEESLAKRRPLGWTLAANITRDRAKL
jgi:hypothetical protein